MKQLVSLAAIVVMTGLLVSAQSPSTTDWPQWRGANRDGISPDTGLLKAWPRSGPPAVWTAGDLGGGFGSVSVSGDRVYVQGLRSRQSTVTSLNRADGKPVWSKVIGAGGDNDRGSGPRSTPTIDGDRVYVLTETGDLACLKVQDGASVWQRNILKDFRGQNLNWLISESPLIDGNNVIVSPGGRGASMVALDKMTGKTVWQSSDLSDEAGYSSAIVADVQGMRTIMTMTSEAGVGVRAADGKLLWRHRDAANRTANAATPVYSDRRVFYTSAYGTGGALLGAAGVGRTGEGEPGVLHARHAESSRRRRPRGRLSVWLQQRHPDLPRVCDRQDHVA